MNKWKGILCSHIGKINVVKKSMSPKQSTDSMQSLSKYKWHFSQTRATNPKLYIESQKTRLAKVILRKEHKVRSIKLPDFKLYYKDICYLSTHTYLLLLLLLLLYYTGKKAGTIDQWNKTKCLEINLCLYS